MICRFRQLALITFVLFLSACSEHVDEYAQRPTLKKVDKVLAPQFVSGEWRYRGARAIEKGIAAYIQIPDRIELSDNQQREYIQMTICPKIEEMAFWESILPYKLYIRTYNYVDRNYVETYCPSPFHN
ncbi:hypothetical protein HR060_04340 [Catenovulum sp. SM1970]|uniref:hypothetical protein n=1 Tax=Marinifaba aquimaris TaxID=2741323 RepID=UPI0015749CAB|nr:hypothetical protein [Marinifaba aquimaris]NTS76090.1 hypothetical protein [Marinifaba aquimaris]